MIYQHKKTKKKYEFIEEFSGIVKLKSVETGNTIWISKTTFKTFYKKVL